MIITIIKKKVNSRVRVGLKDNMVSLVQDERQPHSSQGGVGMLLSITFSQKGQKRVGTRLYLTEHNMAPVHGILEGK